MTEDLITDQRHSLPGYRQRQASLGLAIAIGVLSLPRHQSALARIPADGLTKPDMKVPTVELIAECLPFLNRGFERFPIAAERSVLWNPPRHG